MEQKIHIQEELSALGSSLPLLPLPYGVPGGYFDSLPEWMLRRAKADAAGDSREELTALAPHWQDQARLTPYQVPVGYFESLDLSYIWAEESSVSAELEGLSPLLAGLKKETPFTLPDGYFEEMKGGEAVLKPVEKAPVVRMARSRWFRVAAAAVITGIVASVGFLVFRPGKSIDPNEKSYAWVEKNLKKVDTESIDDLIELAKGDLNGTANVTVSPEIKSLMKDVSDREIQNFLDETGVLETDSDDELILN